MKRSAIYIGPIEHLKGRGALLRTPPEGGFVMAQFYSKWLTMKGLVSFGKPVPDDSLGIGWHVFRRSDFKVDEE